MNDDEVDALVEEVLSKPYEPRRFPIDQNGHLIVREDEPVNMELWFLKHEWFAKRKFEDVFPPDEVLFGDLMSAHECYWCNQRPALKFDGTRLSIPAPCLMVGGAPVEFELAVPSGEIVIRDDLRPVFEDVDDESGDRWRYMSLNNALGQANYSIEAAKLGFAHGQVGNTCPGLYRVDDDHYVIGNPGYSEYDEGEFFDEIPIDGELVASVTTDRWSYQIADAAEWDRRLQEALDANIEEGRWWRGIDVDRVKVKPGIYRFRHHYGERGFDRAGDDGEPVIYAHIERREL